MGEDWTHQCVKKPEVFLIKQMKNGQIVEYTWMTIEYDGGMWRVGPRLEIVNRTWQSHERQERKKEKKVNYTNTNLSTNAKTSLKILESLGSKHDNIFKTRGVYLRAPRVPRTSIDNEESKHQEGHWGICSMPFCPINTAEQVTKWNKQSAGELSKVL